MIIASAVVFLEVVGDSLDRFRRAHPRNRLFGGSRDTAGGVKTIEEPSKLPRLRNPFLIRLLEMDDEVAPNLGRRLVSGIANHPDLFLLVKWGIFAT